MEGVREKSGRQLTESSTYLKPLISVYKAQRYSTLHEACTHTGSNISKQILYGDTHHKVLFTCKQQMDYNEHYISVVGKLM